MTNSVQAADYCGQAINGTSPADGTAITNWYDTYCTKKPTKACMVRFLVLVRPLIRGVLGLRRARAHPRFSRGPQFAESGAAFHVNDAGVSQAAIQQQWCVDPSRQRAAAP